MLCWVSSLYALHMCNRSWILSKIDIIPCTCHSSVPRHPNKPSLDTYVNMVSVGQLLSFPFVQMIMHRKWIYIYKKTSIGSERSQSEPEDAPFSLKCILFLHFLCKTRSRPTSLVKLPPWPQLHANTGYMNRTERFSAIAWVSSVTFIYTLQ